MLADQKTTMVVDVSVGDSVTIGDCQVEMVEKSGRKARLRLHAPSGVLISRQKAEQSAPDIAASMAM